MENKPALGDGKAFRVYASSPLSPTAIQFIGSNKKAIEEFCGRNLGFCKDYLNFIVSDPTTLLIYVNYPSDCTLGMGRAQYNVYLGDYVVTTGAGFIVLSPKKMQREYMI